MGKEKKLRWCSAAVLLVFLVASVSLVKVTEAKMRVSIPDELDDVVDDEEDEAWKEWGKKKSPPMTEFNPPNYDFSQMTMEEIQNEMLKRHSGPTFGFVKLRLGGLRRTPEDVAETAMRWSKVLRTGSIEVKFMAVDLSTIMFTIERGQNTMELKDFILSQEEAYEVRIGEQLFRRHGDPPLDEVVETLRRGNKDGDSSEELDNSRDEL